MPRPDIHRPISNEKAHWSADQAQAAQEAASIAAYISDMSDELSKLASRCDMPMLCYFLNLARVEADMRARELGGYAIDRPS